MMNAKSAVKVKYAKREIEMNTTFAKMIENPLSDEYALLQKLKLENPEFKVTRRQIKSNPNKDSYKGLTYEWMRNHIVTHEGDDTREKVLYEFDEMIYISECHSKRLRYPTIKKWFLAKYPNIAKFGAAEIKKQTENAEEPKSQNVVPFSAAKKTETVEAVEVEATSEEMDEAV